MFDPKSNLNFETLWDSIGTFYHKMDPKGKRVIETYWKALFNGMEGLYYDLYQSNLSSYLEASPGYIEQAYQKYDIVFEGIGVNVEYLPKINGNYYYTLPDEGLYLSIPTLSGLTTGQVLKEGIDYEIHNYRKIKFLTNLSSEATGGGGVARSPLNIQDNIAVSGGIQINTNQLPHTISEVFLSKNSITLLPSLTNFIIPALGQPYPEILLSSGYYEPFTSGWRTGVVTGIEKQKQYAHHLTKWAQAILANFKKPPTVPVLERSYSYLKAFPFAYRGGVVKDISINPNGDDYDYITVRVDEESPEYIHLGAEWSDDVDTSVNGSFFRAVSYNKIPYTTDYAGDNTLDTNLVLDSWIPLTPVESRENVELPMGDVGVHLNGIPFNLLVDAYWNNDPYWRVDIMHSGIVGDGQTYTPEPDHDSWNGSITPQGQYFYQADPKNTYADHIAKHSPIIGYAFDGYPIYGPRGYVNADGTGGIALMTSSYRLKTGTRPTGLDGQIPGPGGSYDGTFRNDYEYISGLGTLDENNGRFAKTPEYPDGVYHYHVTVDSSGNPVFPYVLASFNGVPNFSKSLVPYIETLSTETVDTYEIPTGGKYLVTKDQPVGKFDILLSGITMYDYILDPSKISQILTASGTIQQYDVSVINNFDGVAGFNLGSLSEQVVWTGSVTTGADTVASDESQVITEGDTY